MGDPTSKDAEELQTTISLLFHLVAIFDFHRQLLDIIIGTYN